MKGSGILNYNVFTLDTAFDYFFSNCTFSILSKNSINGFILKLNLVENVKSPFYSITLGENFDKPVTSLILKCILINNKKQKYLIENIKKHTMTEKEFNDEVNIQIDVYNKSITDDEFILQPLCPAIVKIFKNISTNFKDVIYNHFIEKDKKTIKEFFLSDSINIIAMESIEGFDSLSSNCDVKYEKFALFDLMRLHKYGYVHGDYHKGNILINPYYKYYFGDTPELMGRTLILDFGRTKPIYYGNKSINLKSMLENEIDNLSNKTYFSYIWLSYYLYNCLSQTGQYLDYLNQQHIVVNKIIIDNIFKQYPQFDTIDKIKRYLIINPFIQQQQQMSRQTTNESYFSGGSKKSRAKNKSRVRLTRRAR